MRVRWVRVIAIVLVVAGVLLVAPGLARGDGSGERSNLLMRWRVIIQGVTLALFALLIAISRG